MNKTSTCRICQRQVSAGAPVCAACLDAGAWVRISHGAEERRPGQWWATVTKRTSPTSVTRSACGPYDREQALEIAATEARLEAARYSGDWLVEVEADTATQVAA